ncbi:PepSY domain-containing protein [Streptomyces sp. 7N604]|uniref:PepSY domain-containing protein n=1 Tax=Streptomyces sp. 7N604 TaxID=3457415 RepID=UPI003FD0AAC1
MTRYRSGTSGPVRRTAARGARSLIAVSLAAVVSATLAATPANAASDVNVGRRFNDGLDTRYSVNSFTSAARSMGYSATGYTNGRHVDDVFNDGAGAAVLGLFGHANAGIFQTNEGATDAQDSILAAGTTTDVVSPYANVRFMTEYLPFVEVDDMRLLILAGCDTALSSPWGDFNKAAVSRGVDSVISFSDLVYYPGTASGTAVSTTNYSGNYFWDRFSYHAKTGVSVSTALARARTDLVAKEGTAGGWDKYVIRGAVSNPGGVKLKPAGPGQPLDSQPVATAAFPGFAQLTPETTTTSQGPDGTEVTNVTTAEGVLYRVRPDGSILDAVGTPTTSGDTALSAGEARAEAQRFIQANVPGFSSDWRLVTDEAVSHLDGDALQLLQWRTVEAGRAGAREVTTEIDRRTGAVTYLSANHGSATADFRLTAEDAVAAARTAIGETTGTVSAEPDTWNASRWLVTVDRGLTGRSDAQVPDVERVEIDSRDGAVLSRSKT